MSSRDRSAPRLTIICYDIALARRRRKAANALLAFGERIQLSAYACWLNPRERRELVRKVLPLIDPDTDSLRIYELRPEDATRVIKLGPADTEMEQTWLCA